jgi:cytidyltransferase-like protein
MTNGAGRGVVVAIGNFDGLHRGHRSLLARARALANELGADVGVVTFEPHPVKVLASQMAPPLILRRDEKETARRRLMATLEWAVSGCVGYEIRNGACSEGCSRHVNIDGSSKRSSISSAPSLAPLVPSKVLGFLVNRSLFLRGCSLSLYLGGVNVNTTDATTGVSSTGKSHTPSLRATVVGPVPSQSPHTCFSSTGAPACVPYVPRLHVVLR